MTDLDAFIAPWAKSGSRTVDSWHTICSYLGAFPPALANYFIRSFTNEDNWVIDPFGGRGTTALEARTLGRNAISLDLNPIALTLCKAKNVEIAPSIVLDRIQSLESKYDEALYQPEANAQADEAHLIFHPRTLAQLCYLKRKLLKSLDHVDHFILGLCLGILHGGERADGTSGYASIDMPNTFSMSPEYVRKFVQANQLNRLYRNVFDLLREKIKKVFKKHQPLRGIGKVYRIDAKKLSIDNNLKEHLGNIDLVLTSPPYLGIVNYAKQNWIRSWFLDVDPIQVSEQLDDDLNLTEWIDFSNAVITQLKNLLKPSGVAVLVIGDVAKGKNSVIPLAREFARMVRESGLFKNVWCINDAIPDSEKTTKIWADTKGNATTTDRIVILSDINPFGNNRLADDIVPLDFEFVQTSTRFILGS